MEDKNGLWRWNKSSETWYRCRKPLITVTGPSEPLPVVSAGLFGRPSAKQKLGGDGFTMPKMLWPHPDDSSYNWDGNTTHGGLGRFLNDDGVEDKNGLWNWNNCKNTWYRHRAINNAHYMKYYWANRDACLARVRIYDINYERIFGHRRQSRGPRYGNDQAIQEILDQASVREITMPGDEVFLDELEYLNVERRDEVLPSLVRVFGGPNLPSDIDPSNKHSIALGALTDAHDNGVPLVVCDSEYDNRKDVPRKDQTTEFTLGWFSWDGQMLDYLSWKNEDSAMNNGMKFMRPLKRNALECQSVVWVHPSCESLQRLAVMMVLMQCRLS